MPETGFNHEQYLALQAQHIRERIDRFGGKLYLEFGGKLFDDFHASRVLPGFRPDSKVEMLLQLKEEAEIILVINASDIEKNKARSDLGITYDQDVLRMIDAFRAIGLYVGSVVITQYNGEGAAANFQKRLESQGVQTYRHYSIDGYPSDPALIVSENGYGKNEYIKTERPLAVVTAPGPGSGKMAVCLSQLYHDHEHGINAGYAKFETFPVWNLPLNHPVNLAYEAATVDLNDVNMIDPFHLEAYNVTAINYNRDVEIFPVLSAIFEKIAGCSPYRSPTDMGVNMAGACIQEDDIVRKASCDEIIRRYYHALCKIRKGLSDEPEAFKLELLMKKAGVTPQDRPVIAAADHKAQETALPAVALELPDGKIITGKTSSLLGASAALILNALKALGGIHEDMPLLSPLIIEPIQELKTKILGNSNPRLHTDEILVALSISAATNPTADLAMRQLPKLRGLQAHSTVILASVDETVFRKLGVHITCNPHYQTKRLYHG